MNIDNIHAGAYLTGKDFMALKMKIVSNTVSRVCLFDVWDPNMHYLMGKNVCFDSQDLKIRKSIMFRKSVRIYCLTVIRGYCHYLNNSLYIVHDVCRYFVGVFLLLKTDWS